MPEANTTGALGADSETATAAAADAVQPPEQPPEQRRSARQHCPRYVDNALTGNEVFDLLDEYIVDSDSGQRPRRPRKRRKRSPTAPAAAAAVTGKAIKGGKERPRWYNQMYVMFLALRQSAGHTAGRSELVRKAVELDGRISAERGLPRAFTGKTPMNSASALLTNNGDRHFVQFRPPGAKCYHFRLAYNPGDFASALAAYNDWIDVLVSKDWPICFGPEPDPAAPDPAAMTPATDPAAMTPATDAAAAQDPNAPLPEPPRSNDTVQMSGLDAVNIPKSWSDIVEVRASTIPNAGNGLFAVRDLPAGIPLGFYFGVPMTEDEFDSLKETVGMASHYSIMYRKTVLDATDEHGMPYTDPAGPLYCPFHFMNEARAADGGGDRCNITFLEGIKVNQVICMTARPIPKGAELFVSYGEEVDRSHWDGASSSAEPRDSGAATDHTPPPASPVSMPSSPSHQHNAPGAAEQSPAHHLDIASALQTFAAPSPLPPADSPQLKLGELP
ncbi:hypothetical protein H4R19_001571 [Coemansia spiralis]|nr:hypothetical protein H4R19_001571 [Coemansia spiralis]